MKNIKIITDSTVDLPKEVLEKYNIEVIPLMVNFGEESYFDGVDITAKELFERIEKGDTFPSTAQVTPIRFEQKFKQFLDEGYSVIAILMSSVMSGTYQSACIAREMLGSDDIRVIDSKLVCSSLGLLVIKAAKLLEEGLGLDDIVDKLEETKTKIDCSLSFDSLDNLVKGGRISKTVGIITGVLGIKIILDMREGIMAVKDKVRGNKKAVKRILSDVNIDKLDPYMPVVITNVDMEEITLPIKQFCMEHKLEYIEGTVGCTVGIHSGKKVGGIFFCNK